MYYWDSYIVANATWWNKLPEDLRNTIMKEVCAPLSKEATESVMTYSEQTIAELNRQIADTGEEYRAALQQLSRYDWVIFTSANGVNAFMGRLFHMGLDVRVLGRARLAVIGPATAQALRDYGLVADVVPDTFQAEGLLSVLAPRVLGGTRLLLARAEQARAVLPDGLIRLGAKLDVVPVYRALPPLSVPPEAAELLSEGHVDILTFTSSSTVHNFAGLVGPDQFQKLAARATVASIGPITTATLKKYGITPRIEPAAFTIPALAAAIIEYFRKG
jgi:uroporphyrinogen III methyltransferase/synthase